MEYLAPILSVLIVKNRHNGQKLETMKLERYNQISKF